MSATLDPDQRGTIPVCPRCGGTTRRDLDTNQRRCDLHGPVTPVWVAYTDDEEENARDEK